MMGWRINVSSSICVVLWLCWLGIGATPVESPLKKLSMEEMRDIMATVPKAERKDFIRNNVVLGYKIQQQRMNWSDEQEGQLAVEIFNYFVDNQEAIAQRKQVINEIYLNETICFPPPIGCIDTDDAGIHPGT